MLVKLSTNKTVSETAVALQAAVQANHFGVMQVHNLKEMMFNAPHLEGVAQEVEATIVKIMKEAASG
jgi:hypothetical protein